MNRALVVTKFTRILSITSVESKSILCKTLFFICVIVVYGLQVAVVPTMQSQLKTWQSDVTTDVWVLTFELLTLDTYQLRFFEVIQAQFILFPSEFVKGASAKSFVIIVLRDTQTVLIGHMCFVKSSVKYILLETSKLVMDFCMRFSRF